MRYLRNMVERNMNSGIKTMDVYEDVPWLLDHISDPLFKKNLWYYFVPRTKQSRTVPGRGESEGGTWKSTGKKSNIEDENNRHVGYKRSLVFNRKVKGKVSAKTNWFMTEFLLHKDGGEFQDLVLVLIRYKKDNLLGFNDAPRVEEEDREVPRLEREDREVPRLERGDVDLDNYVNDLERTLIEERDPQEKQQNTSNLALPPPPQSNDDMMISPLPPSLQGQGFGFQTMITTTQSNGNDFFIPNNVLMQNNGNDFFIPNMENIVFMRSFDNNFSISNNNHDFMQNNGNDFFIPNNGNNFVMQSNGSDFFIPNNVLMPNNGNDFFILNNENNVLMQNNLVMQNNDNNVLMQSNGNSVLMQNNGDNSMWNHLDNFGFEGTEFEMLDLDGDAE